MMEDVFMKVEPYWVVEYTLVGDDSLEIREEFDDYEKAVAFFFERHRINPEGLTSLIKRFR